MILRPCLHCPFRRDCSIKANIHRRVRGLGLTVAGFRCTAKWIGIMVGARVEISTKLIWRESGGEHESVERQGTVIGFKNDRAVVWLDEPLDDDLRPEPRVRVKVRRDRLRLVGSIDAPLVHCCRECGRPGCAKNREDWSCRTCDEDDAEGPTQWSYAGLGGWLG